MKFVFFGSSELSLYVLEYMKKNGLIPSLIITTPDKPKGRKLVMTPTVVKDWAIKNEVGILDPVSLKKDDNLPKILEKGHYDFFIVASYGKIIPENIFSIPRHKTINIHPSLLPKYRGASPIQSQILNNEKEVGVTIMQIDAGMDSGPIIAKKVLNLEYQKENRAILLGRIELEKKLAEFGTSLFLEIIEDWLGGKIRPKTQKESEATFCQKITKEDGLINLGDDPWKNFLKIKALEGWPGTYFFLDNESGKTRVIIKEAHWHDDKLLITKVLPEGRTLMSYDDFMRGYKK